jgi:hypothetical protein
MDTIVQVIKILPDLRSKGGNSRHLVNDIQHQPFGAGTGNLCHQELVLRYAFHFSALLYLFPIPIPRAGHQYAPGIGGKMRPLPAVHPRTVHHAHVKVRAAPAEDRACHAIQPHTRLAHRHAASTYYYYRTPRAG